MKVYIVESGLAWEERQIECVVDNELDAMLLCAKKDHWDYSEHDVVCPNEEDRVWHLWVFGDSRDETVDMKTSEIFKRFGSAPYTALEWNDKDFCYSTISRENAVAGFARLVRWREDTKKRNSQFTQMVGLLSSIKPE